MTNREQIKYYVKKEIKKGKEKGWTYHCKRCDEEIFEPDFNCKNHRCVESKYYLTKEELKQKIYGALHYRGYFELIYHSVPDPVAKNESLCLTFKTPQDADIHEIEFVLDYDIDPIPARAINLTWRAPVDFEWFMKGIIPDSELEGVLKEYIKKFESMNTSDYRIKLREEEVGKNPET